MVVDKRYKLLYEAILCSFAFMVFSFFIHYEFPLRLISFAALLLPAYFFSRNLSSCSDFRTIVGTGVSPEITILYYITGLFAGMLLAALYRWHLDLSLFPRSIHMFVISAALIGCAEELVFRGFIQDYVKTVNAPLSILFSTISHTGYKCCLFLAPVIAAEIDIGFLAFWTFIAGILFGTIRHFSKSILPSLIAHGLFDVLVYAEYASAPWWVW